MRTANFEFNVEFEIEKLQSKAANLANPANPSNEISKISRISNNSNIENYNVENDKNEISKAAIPAISAIFGEKVNRNSKNSRNSNQIEFENLDLNLLKNFLGEDWFLYKDDKKVLMAWSNLLAERRLIENGKIPKKFTAITYCKSCKQYVFVPPEIVNGDSILGCMWCANRTNGYPIPDAKKHAKAIETEII